MRFPPPSNSLPKRNLRFFLSLFLSSRLASLTLFSNGLEAQCGSNSSPVTLVSPASSRFQALFFSLYLFPLPPCFFVEISSNRSRSFFGGSRPNRFPQAQVYSLFAPLLTRPPVGSFGLGKDLLCRLSCLLIFDRFKPSVSFNLAFSSGSVPGGTLVVRGHFTTKLQLNVGGQLAQLLLLKWTLFVFQSAYRFFPFMFHKTVRPFFFFFFFFLKRLVSFPPRNLFATLFLPPPTKLHDRRLPFTT